MANEDPLPYLFDLLSVTRLVVASFLPVLRFAHLLTTVPLEFSESVPPLEQQLSPFSFFPQSLPLQYIFGTTSLRSAWRSIWSGNRGGLP
jgi:hypothetical protein